MLANPPWRQLRARREDSGRQAARFRIGRILSQSYCVAQFNTAQKRPGSPALLEAKEGVVDEAQKQSLCLANCYEGRYYRQIAPRKGDASPFLNGLGDSETIGAAKRTATKSAHTA